MVRNKILGYRRNGAPIYEIKGGAPTDEERIETLLTDANAHLDEADEITRTYGSDLTNAPAGQRERHARATSLAVAKTAEADDLRAFAGRRARALEAAGSDGGRSGNLLVESGQSHTGGGQEPSYAPRRRSNPWAGLGDNAGRADTFTGMRARAFDAIALAPDVPDFGRNKLAEMMDDKRIELERDAPELILAGLDPSYRSAFIKIMRDPQQGHLMWTGDEQLAYQRVAGARAAMGLTNVNGGYLLPFTLDPTIIETNAGTANPFRTLARQVLTSTNTWNGVNSAGVTAEWTAEAAEFADASPTVGNVQITPAKADALIVASWEIIADTDIASQIPDLISDAKARLESTAFAAGSGTNQPWGLVTRVAAVTTSRVSPGTGGTLSGAADIYTLYNALTPRARQSASRGFLANNTVISKIRGFDVYGGSSFWSDMNGPTPARLLGVPIYESSPMDAAITTGSNAALAGDFSRYIVVDRLGVTLVLDPMVLGPSRRPTGQSQWVAYWRTGGDCADTGAFRVMRL
jgi:HK97 family phage major capsid protein